jgi:hypothetical protein
MEIRSNEQLDKTLRRVHRAHNCYTFVAREEVAEQGNILPWYLQPHRDNIHSG